MSLHDTFLALILATLGLSLVMDVVRLWQERRAGACPLCRGTGRR